MRIRDLGYSPGQLQPGPQNSILDVKGVRVGQTTIHEGQDIHTGVTVILPRGPDEIRQKPCYAAIHKLNGMGELTGGHQIEEFGSFNTPIAITNSISIGKVYDAIYSWMFDLAKQNQESFEETFRNIGIPVVGETLDCVLNDVTKSAVEKSHVYQAIESALSDPPLPVLEGSYGGGTGMRCHGYKGGTGTSSRIVPGRSDDETFTVGVLVQANYGHQRDLQIGGVPVGRILSEKKPTEPVSSKFGEGSIIIVIMTDAPLLPHQLRRVAQRATAGLSQVTGHGAGRTYSGDIFLAVSTGNIPDDSLDTGLPGYLPTVETFNIQSIKNECIDSFFYAAAEATEEAILNALVGARDGLTGFMGHRAEGLPVDRVKELLETYRVKI
ncbi:peptidase family S58-domain-containing protein [Talaromyces proteolyticus]|uniref:Peptidase family S58-domain-containing protein n=1 Tax=Talaromyces proteolyticus TaxID=1131652 RepID=A0AAD4KZJ3_9EURO|nr:peptidase family S58-domain-containing protein [Talaromyces proteolyticus]KAH8703499.1 peptidase family S58-domain-containing protein [Talaromyces proteolyticus]